MISVKSDMEYIVSTGHTIADDGTIPINIKAELVRCMDCKYYFQKDLSWCGVYGSYDLKPDDYCSKGKRREWHGDGK